MKPAPFDLLSPASIADAVAMLTEADGEAKPVAGGQSLGPMLNLRLVQPQLLVDLAAIPEMTDVEENADAVVLGACITASNIEDRRVPDPTRGALPQVAAGIGYRAVRNRGTIGGSLCHADPAADWLSALSALGAECIVATGAGRRLVPIAQFVLGAFEVALDPGEVLAAVRIPKVSKNARWGYYKICRKAGEFAMAIGAVLADPERDVYRVVMGGTHGRPIVIEDARDYLGAGPTANGGLELDEAATVRLLDQHAIADPVARRLHTTTLKRAVVKAAT